MKDKKKRNLFLLLVVLLTISVGFALLSTTLFINGSSTIKGNTWDIHWDEDSIEETEGSFTPTTPAYVTDEEGTSISFNVEFELPGDFYEFTVDAVNEGTVDGIIESVEINYYEEGATEASSLPDEINYTVTYVPSGTPAKDDVLEAGHSQKYKVRLEFDSEEDELPEEAISGTYEFKVNYQQHKSSN